MLDTVSESGEKTAQTLVGGLLSSIHGVTPQNYTELQISTEINLFSNSDSKGKGNRMCDLLSKTQGDI